MSAPEATLEASLAGGAWSTGGLDASLSDTVDLRNNPSADSGVTAWLVEIYDYPSGFACPAGWSTASDGTYYYNTNSSFPQWTVTAYGKYMLRLTVNSAIRNGVTDADSIDESTAIRVITVAGLHSVGEREMAQWENSWVKELQHDLAICGAGGLAAPTDPGDNYKVAYANSGTLGYADEVKVVASETALAIGATTAATGDLRGDTAFKLVALNGANDLDTITISSGAIVIGENTHCASQDFRAATGGDFDFLINNVNQFTVGAGFVEVTAAGAAVSGSGTIRLPEDASIQVLNAAGPTTTYLVGINNNDVTLGDVTNAATSALKASTTLYGYVGANAAWTANASGHTWKVGATSRAVLNATGLGVWTTDPLSPLHVNGACTIQTQAGTFGKPSHTYDDVDIWGAIYGPSEESGVSLLAQDTNDFARWQARLALKATGGGIPQMIGQFTLRDAADSVTYTSDSWTVAQAAVTWGNTTDITSAAISTTSAGTLYGNVGANAAWSATTTGHTWKAGANQVASLNATTATWGHASNVATSDISATTTLHGYVGANAAWTANAAGHTFKVGAVATLNLADGEAKHYGSDANDYTRIITGATTTTLARVTNSGTSNSFLTATENQVMVGDATNTQTVDLQGAAAAATIRFFYGALQLGEIDDGGLTLQDSGAATAYVTIQHDSVLFSKANTGGVTFDIEDVTAAANGNDFLMTGSGCPYGNTPADLIFRGSKTATGTPRGHILLQDADGNTGVDVTGSSTTVEVGFFGATPAAKPTVNGARDNPEAALANLLSELAGLGLITNSTTAS